MENNLESQANRKSNSRQRPLNDELELERNLRGDKTGGVPLDELEGEKAWANDFW